ncbi:hypothetical protein Tco_0803535 [Tanacetum coccineum]|uniref:Reverse transcriptase domain-containing protein n=1 Tax=Tanacetum coccineum TaxID=301880 RepID=A0ABQ5A5Y8_9ASTR
MKGVSKTDFENYVKANDVVLRNMQNQGQGLQNQMTNLMEMLSKFVNSNTASTSSSGSLPSNTVANPKEDFEGFMIPRSRYSANYNDMTANRIDVVELACEEYSQEVLGFSDVIAKVEEADAFLALAEDPTLPEVDESYYDPEGDILILEALFNKDYELAVQHQRRVNPKIHDVIKKEVEKLLDTGLIYPISDSPWVSLVHCVPKKGGMSVVTNAEIDHFQYQIRLVTGLESLY